GRTRVRGAPAASPPPAWRRRCGAARRARGLLRRPWRGEARVQRQAAVDEDGLAGDVGRLVAGEEAGDAGHLVGGAGAAQRDVLLDLAGLDGVVDPRAVD